MIIFSHMKIASYFYNKNPLSIEKWAFIYGNIKPDITALSREKHHYETTRLVFIKSLKDAGNLNLSKRERSIALGVACHFICDYFCKFHAKTPYNETMSLSHLEYELKLHLALWYNRLRFRKKGKVLVDSKGAIIAALHHTCTSSYDIDAVIHSLLAMYHEEKESLQIDLAFSFEAVE